MFTKPKESHMVLDLANIKITYVPTMMKCSNAKDLKKKTSKSQKEYNYPITHHRIFRIP